MSEAGPGSASRRDTIVAVASPPGGGSRAVLRLSGPDSGALVAAALGLERPPAERGVSAGRFHDGVGSQPCLLFWMPGPRSYTREDVAEVHLKGSPPLVAVALARLLELGARSAQPGEFTRRAFASGRIDLTRAEGVLGLIEAADRAAARSAAALLGGGLGDRIAGLRERLDALRALCEASLDFESEETGHVEAEALLELLAAAEGELDEALLWEQRREPARGRPRVVLAGRPNAGKSSLFNRLVGAGDERALVSDLAGSTRDGVSLRWRLGGVDLELFDAPGFELLPPADLGDADAQAQELAEQQRRGADLVLWCLPLPELLASPGALLADRARLPEGAEVVPVLTQVDRLDGGRTCLRQGSPVGVLRTSSRTAVGLTQLADDVARRLGLLASGEGPGAEVAAAAALGRELSARHRSALVGARRALAAARADLEAVALGLPLDQVAEVLRSATSELDAITGETTPEDLLDRIFSGFCLGK